MKFKICNLSFEYFKGQKLIEHFNFESDSRLIGVIGKNGCGKSTLFKLISGELTPDSGFVIKEGRVYRSIYDFHYYNKFTINELLILLRKLQSFDLSNLMNYITGLNIEKFLDEELGNLSQGTYKKVGLLLSFLSVSELLLLDEPFESIDLQTREFIINTIIESNRNIMLIDHDIDVVKRICPTIINFDLW